MEIVILLLLAYLLGAIPSGVIIGKVFFKKDIRDFGSGNIGTTNTFRVLGKQAGVVVLLADVLKGTLATLLPVLLSSNLNPLLCGLLAVIGHTFSVFIGFKGGKAVATSGGVILGFAPAFFVLVLIIFLICLYITSIVSFSSITAASLALLGVIFFPIFQVPILPERNWAFLVLATFFAGFIIIRHKENIKRIQAKTESTVSFGLNVLKMDKK